MSVTSAKLHIIPLNILKLILDLPLLKFPLKEVYITGLKALLANAIYVAKKLNVLYHGGS